jgi:acyl carrier protein
MERIFKMELSEEKIVLSIFKAIDVVNKMLPEERRLKKQPDVFLAGERGKLESLELINFIVELEGRLQKDFGLTFNLIEWLEIPEESMKRIDGLAKFIKAQAN